MAFASSFRMLSPIIRSLSVNGPRVCSRPTSIYMANHISSSYSQPSSLQQIRNLGSDTKVYSRSTSEQGGEKTLSLASVLEREIQEETAELNQTLSSDQFPGFSIETEDADVRLTKQVGDTTVVVRFTVSSSLTDWRTESSEQDQPPKQDEDVPANYTLLSLPDFEVQITRNNRTMEVSCYFEELDHDEETGEPIPMDPVFNINELVMYEGEPRETEFAVSTEYFREDLQDSLSNYLASHGIDHEFAKNLVGFATNYEKKQYIGLMRRMKDFVSA